MPEESPLTQALQRQFRQLRLLYFIYLMAAIAALAAFFVSKPLTLAILGISVIYHLFLVRRRAKAYEAAFVHTCIQYTLEQHLTEAVHTGKPVLTLEELRSVRLIADNRRQGSILLREGGSGRHNGKTVQLGDATFAHSFPMNGKTHHEFVVGCWVRVELERDTGLDWRLLAPHVMLPAARDAFRAKNPDLQGLYTEGEIWKNYLILRPAGTPDLPEKPAWKALEKLVRKARMPLAVCIQGNVLHVLLVNYVLGQKVSVRIEPDAALVEQDLLPELDAIFTVADALSIPPADPA